MITAIQQLEEWQTIFLEKAGVNRNIGSDHRTARVFGAVYAAGKLAQRFGILPRELSCGPSALACYRLYRSYTLPHKPFIDRLEALVAGGDILMVSANRDKLQSKRALDALGTLTVTPTHRELRISQANIGRAIADWKTIWKTDEVRALLVPADGRALKPKVCLAPGLPAKRAWCFRLPLRENTLLGDPQITVEGKPSSGCR